jgi:hypothetical protein
MEAATVGTRASERLLADKEALARAITGALYEETPALMQRYGEAGREKCLQDMRYNLEHLASAVDLAQPAMFAGYVRWLDGLLRARNVSTDEVVRSLELTDREIRERFPAEEAEAVAPCIGAGLAALSGEEAS